MSTTLNATNQFEIDFYSDSQMTNLVHKLIFTITLSQISGGGYTVQANDITNTQFVSFTSYPSNGTSTVVTNINQGAWNKSISLNSSFPKATLIIGYQGGWGDIWPWPLGCGCYTDGIAAPYNLADLTLTYDPNTQYVDFTFNLHSGLSQPVHMYVDAFDPCCPQNFYLNFIPSTLEFQMAQSNNNCSNYSGTNGGTYPNCTCAEPSQVFSSNNGGCIDLTPNSTCPSNATGTYPNCYCPSNYMYDVQTNTCNPCTLCPSNSSTPTQCNAGGCQCPANYTYDSTKNQCIPPTCPENNGSVYPNCQCTECYLTYNNSSNQCVPTYNACPSGATGTPPSCVCDNGTYDSCNNVCKTTQGSCPSGATGTYPYCTCPNGYTYNQSSNTCVLNQGSCPSGASGTYPYCTCPNGYSYNQSLNTCSPTGGIIITPNTKPWYENMWLWLGLGAGGFILLLVLMFTKKR